MKRKLIGAFLIALLLGLLPVQSWAVDWSTTKGFNFRAALAYVTDGSNEQMVNNNGGDGVYPTTDTIGGDSVTYGWDVTTVTRDRSSSVDRRLAGLHYYGTGSANATFRIDLPATGDYKIRLAIGDASNAQTDHWVDVQDNGSTLFNIGGGTVDTASGHFLDANGNDYASADWPGSNTQRTITMTSTVLLIVNRSVSGVGYGELAHVEVEQVLSASPTVRTLNLLGVGR